MTIQESTHRALASSGRAIASLLRTLPPDLALFKSAAHQWNALEIINHLADEETEDFRPRIQHILSGATAPWPSIDPEAWPRERNYAQRDLGDSLERFLDARSVSLGWLKGLPEKSAWDQALPVPPGLRAGDLAAAWVDHDLAHLAQLTRLLAQALQAHANPFSSEYSGANWHPTTAP
jgi:hypothetical protein